ncbi:hypothetical protein BUALT_Bualt12G0098800 [Buddleja alternifolia]|uniref:RING-type domain-containing protein n=1 Tax=Buddleja alternifolia TaxID=168488 RepID=A0AAV6WP03_9LAMI|nr:hypothetical protein BUALT_Bualt12G0098800 [Buddleja alternifolia]
MNPFSTANLEKTKEQIMDPMDVDHTVDVPDTPDRLATRGLNVRSGFREENHSSSTPSHLQQQKFSEVGSKDQPMVIDSGSRGLSRNSPKRTSRSGNSLHPINSTASSLVSTSSSRNGLLFRKGVTGKNPSCKSHDSFHTQHQQTVRPSCISESSSQDNSFADRTKRNLHRTVFRNSFPGGMPGNNGAELRMNSGTANGASSLSDPINVSTASEGTSNMNGVGSSSKPGQGVQFAGDIQNKPGNGGFLSLDPIASPRVNKQKRLVRNGCISPNNIAKGKQLAGKDNNATINVTHANNGSMESSAPPVSIDIRELVAEDNDFHRGKGKGVISHLCSSRESDFKNKNLHSRSSMSSNKKAVETSDNVRDAGKSIEEVGAWRSTRNRTRKNHLSFDEEWYLNREMDAPRSSSQHHENRMERREKGNVATGDNYPKDQNLISSEQFHTEPLRESVIHPGTRFGRLNGCHSAANTIIKRQKQASTSSSFNECSTLVSDDPEVEFLGSSAETSNRPSSTSVGNLQPVIEVDEFSPQLRCNAHDEDARTRQVEADELLARELQEQLYNEVSTFRDDEIDEHIALGLHNQDFSYNGASRARRPALDARGSLTSNLHRQSQSRSSSNAPRRGALARASTLGRMTGLRSRFPGQPRTILPSRGRTSLFPANMDVDMRMHILGTLEAFSDLGVGPGAGILQTNRDFNEDDYEMLLALDENNDRHGGASVHRINSLPQSTLQSDNFEEACAICLETPTIGDTIRHLPCLHKFHKDCIDPWLRRKTSCPVCKSSIT